MSQIIDMFGNINISKKMKMLDETDLIKKFEDFLIMSDTDDDLIIEKEEWDKPFYQENSDKMSVVCETDLIEKFEDFFDEEESEELEEGEMELRLAVKYWDGKSGNDYEEHDYDSEEHDFDYWTSDNDFED